MVLIGLLIAVLAVPALIVIIAVLAVPALIVILDGGWRETARFFLCAAAGWAGAVVVIRWLTGLP